MALALNDRVQQTGTANTTVSFTLSGSVPGFQSFAVIGNGNTTYYSATDSSGNWEVGLGTYSTTGPTLTRTTILSSSNSNTAVTFSGSVNVFVTYPSSKSVNLDGSGNASALGTISSGTWNGSTIGVAYGGTGVTASSGANSVVLRDADGNIAGVNNVEVGFTVTTAAGGITALTAASTQIQALVGSTNQTFKLPDATTLHTGVFYTLSNASSGVLTITDYAGTVIETIGPGGAAQALCTSAATVAGTWGFRVFAASNVTWGNANLDYNGTITSATWNGGTVQPAYGGTGLTTFTAANNALYSSGATTLTAGTLPIAAGGTGQTTRQDAIDALAGAVTSGQYLRGNGTDVVMSAIQAADVPTLNQNTTGTASNVTGTVAIANGGTGETTRQNAMDALAGAVTSGQYLRGNGTDVVMSAIQAADVPTLNQNTTGSSGSCTGNAATVTNGVYTTGTQSIGGAKTFTSDLSLSGTAPRLFFTDTDGTNFSLYNQGNIFYLLNGSGSGVIQCDTSGNFTATANVTAYSDERLKKDWANLSPTFLEDLSKVKYGTYTRIDSGERQVGASAQDMQKILPESVLDGEHLSLAYGNAALVAAIELAKQVVELKKEIELLKAK